MVHQNTIFKNYFSIYWVFFFLEKWEFIGYSMHLYWRLKSLHFPWTAGCKLPRLYCSDELYLVAMKKKKTRLREREFLTPLLSRRPLLFQSNINFKVIVHAVMGKQRGIVTLCYYIEPSQYGSMNYSSNEQIIYIV